MGGGGGELGQFGYVNHYSWGMDSCHYAGNRVSQKRTFYLFCLRNDGCHGNEKATKLRTAPTIVIAHTFCASGDTRISYG